MSATKALTSTKLKPDSYQIPQTVTSPVERREIRNFIEMRQNQIKARLDRIYKYKKEQYVEKGYATKVDAVIKNAKLVNMVKQYNKDNNKLKTLLDEKKAIVEQLDNLCDAKQRISERLKNYTNAEDDLNYNPSTYGNTIERHSKKAISTEELLNEPQVKDHIKANFDTKNSKQMENRNRRLKYLKEMIEERLLFGKRDEIQELFCSLEQMNTTIEKELVNFGIDNFNPVEEGGK